MVLQNNALIPITAFSAVYLIAPFNLKPEKWEDTTTCFASSEYSHAAIDDIHKEILGRKNVLMGGFKSHLWSWKQENLDKALCSLFSIGYFYAEPKSSLLTPQGA